MVRTLDGALEFVRTHGLVTEVPTHGAQGAHHGQVPSLHAAVGDATKANLLFRLGKALRASPEVVALRLWEGKMTFVAQRLWPEVYRVVMEPSRRRSALAGLSADARALLERVEREGDVRLPQHAWAKERETLETRLLVQASDIHDDEEGRWLSRLQSWRTWAPEGVKAIADGLSYEEALRALASPEGHAPTGPWLPAL